MMAGGENARRRDPLPAARGAAWFMLSLELLRRQASRLLFIAILMQLVLGLVQVPLLGILVVLSVPGLTAGILQAFHVTARGGAPAMRLLFLPLATGNRRGRLFALGALVFAVGILAGLSLGTLVVEAAPSGSSRLTNATFGLPCSASAACVGTVMAWPSMSRNSRRSCPPVCTILPRSSAVGRCL